MIDGVLVAGLCAYGFWSIWGRLNRLEGEVKSDLQRLEEYHSDPSLRAKYQEEKYDPHKTAQAIVDGQIRKGMTFEEVAAVLEKFGVKGGLYPTVLVAGRVEKRIVAYRHIGGSTEKIEFTFKDGRLLSWKDFNVNLSAIVWPRSKHSRTK